MWQKNGDLAKYNVIIRQKCKNFELLDKYKFQAFIDFREIWLSLTSYKRHQLSHSVTIFIEKRG